MLKEPFIADSRAFTSGSRGVVFTRLHRAGARGELEAYPSAKHKKARDLFDLLLHNKNLNQALREPVHTISTTYLQEVLESQVRSSETGFIKPPS